MSDSEILKTALNMGFCFGVLCGMFVGLFVAMVARVISLKEERKAAAKKVEP